MGDYLESWPPIDEDLVARLNEMYPITDADLSGSEWDRAFLAGQRDVVKKIESIRQQQKKRSARAQHKRL